MADLPGTGPWITPGTVPGLPQWPGYPGYPVPVPGTTTPPPPPDAQPPPVEPPAPPAPLQPISPEMDEAFEARPDNWPYDYRDPSNAPPPEAAGPRGGFPPYYEIPRPPRGGYWGLRGGPRATRPGEWYIGSGQGDGAWSEPLERYRSEFVRRVPRDPRIETPPGRLPPVFEPSFPFPLPRPRRALPVPRRLPRELDWPSRPPAPLPGERNPNRVLPPGIETSPTAPPTAPLEVPSPQLPAPRSPEGPQLPPPRSPEAPQLPQPQPIPGRLPAPPRPRLPRVARWPGIAGAAATAGSILRRYIVRRARPELVPRFDFRDAIPPTVGLPEALPQTLAPPQVAPPTVAPSLPDLLPDLTPFSAAALPFSQPATRRRQEECRCEESEEEAEERRELNASNVVAQVKPFTRRMSQNSLDNLE